MSLQIVFVCPSSYKQVWHRHRKRISKYDEWPRRKITSGCKMKVSLNTAQFYAGSAQNAAQWYRSTTKGNWYATWCDWRRRIRAKIRASWLHELFHAKRFKCWQTSRFAGLMTVVLSRMQNAVKMDWFKSSAALQTYWQIYWRWDSAKSYRAHNRRYRRTIRTRGTRNSRRNYNGMLASASELWSKW